MEIIVTVGRNQGPQVVYSAPVPQAPLPAVNGCRTDNSAHLNKCIECQGALESQTSVLIAELKKTKWHTTCLRWKPVVGKREVNRT